MKRILLSLIFVAAASSANAQTTTTTTLSLGGIVNCRSITLSVIRTQGTETKTNISFTIKECDPGRTIPNRVIASFNSPILNDDFTLNQDGTGAHLRTNSPYGIAEINWSFVNAYYQTYDAVWNMMIPYTGAPIQTQNDIYRSVLADGSIGSYPVERSGNYTLSVIKK